MTVEIWQISIECGIGFPHCQCTNDNNNSSSSSSSNNNNNNNSNSNSNILFVGHVTKFLSFYVCLIVLFLLVFNSAFDC